MISVFIGFDPREEVAFHVLQRSIHKRSSLPVSITPLKLNQLPLTRPRDPLQSTDFAFSRFLVPYLSGFKGWSVFMDCDMLVLDDIAKLYALRDEKYAVMVVKHSHVPREDRKFLDQPQSSYACKNWSSVMLFNNRMCPVLTPDYVNTASGLTLHQFRWVGTENLIGELPKRWNHLVGYDQPREDVSLVHYTLGGPYFDEYENCDRSFDWRLERHHMLQAD